MRNKKSQSDDDDELDWDFYFYVGNTLLGLSMDDFFNITPAHLMKQFIMHLQYTNPKALNEEKSKVKEVHYIDQTPFR